MIQWLWNTGDMGSIPGRGTKVTGVAEYLSSHGAVTEPVRSRVHMPQPESLCTSMKDPA